MAKGKQKGVVGAAVKSLSKQEESLSGLFPSQETGAANTEGNKSKVSLSSHSLSNSDDKSSPPGSPTPSQVARMPPPLTKPTADDKSPPPTTNDKQQEEDTTSTSSGEGSLNPEDAQAHNDLFDSGGGPGDSNDHASTNLNFIPISTQSHWYKIDKSDAPMREYNRTKKMFLQHLREFQGWASSIPNIEALVPPAYTFVSSIFGNMDSTPAEQHLHLPLNYFMSIISARPLHVLAGSLLPDRETYRLNVRYFGGLQGKRERISHATKVASFLKSYFSVKFSNPDETCIQTCVERARTLYITAFTAKEDLEGKREERIVSAINFASMGPHGFYVNWLATSDEVITSQTYGLDFETEASGGTWQKRHLAIFLLQITNLAIGHNIASNVQIKNAPNFIVLQARTDPKEKAQKFYRYIGFDEMGYLDSDSELSLQVFQEFPQLLEESNESTSDFIHFIRDLQTTPDLAVFRNSTGLFTPTKSRMKVNPQYHDVSFVDSPTAFSFPFSCKREHLMLLSIGLDYFFLPFRMEGDLQKFITPSCSYHHDTTVSIGNFDRGCLLGKPLFNPPMPDERKTPSLWLSDAIIDFFGCWYVNVLIWFQICFLLFTLFSVLFSDRLMMDGTTKASLYSCILPISDVSRLTYDCKEGMGLKNVFQNCIETADKFKRRGLFEKRWMIVPINFNREHWGLIALLNPTYLMEDQNVKFSAFLYYDPLFPNTPREEIMEVMMRKGLLNFLVYANLAYGHPRLTSKPENASDMSQIKNMLLDDSRFTMITIPDSDYIEQDDGHNCGVYTCLIMMEIAMIHSHHYVRKEDFVEITDQRHVSLKPFHFGSLFSVHETIRTKRQKNKVFRTIPISVLDCFRDQVCCLFNRILTLKAPYTKETKEKFMFHPMFPKRCLSKEMAANFRLHIWDINPKDRELVNAHNNWFLSKEKKEELLRFLGCTNMALTNPEMACPFSLVENEEEDDDDENRLYFSEEEMKAAGMIPIDDLPPEEGVNEEEDGNGNNDNDPPVKSKREVNKEKRSLKKKKKKSTISKQNEKVKKKDDKMSPEATDAVMGLKRLRRGNSDSESTDMEVEEDRKKETKTSNNDNGQQQNNAHGGGVPDHPPTGSEIIPEEIPPTKALHKTPRNENATTAATKLLHTITREDLVNCRPKVSIEDERREGIRSGWNPVFSVDDLPQQLPKTIMRSGDVLTEEGIFEKYGSYTDDQFSGEQRDKKRARVSVSLLAGVPETEEKQICAVEKQKKRYFTSERQLWTKLSSSFKTSIRNSTKERSWRQNCS